MSSSASRVSGSSRVPTVQWVRAFCSSLGIVSGRAFYVVSLPLSLSLSLSLSLLNDTSPMMHLNVMMHLRMLQCRMALAQDWTKA